MPRTFPTEKKVPTVADDHDTSHLTPWDSATARRELVTEPGLERPMASNIQSDIIWLQFPETKIRLRKFRMWLQISKKKKNRGEGQKTDHKRIFVTQFQLGETDMSSADGKRQRNLLFLPCKGGPKFPSTLPLVEGVFPG